MSKLNILLEGLRGMPLNEAQYDVKYSCGHTGTVKLFGKHTERERKIAWYEKEGLCPACYKKHMNKLRDDENKKLSLPKLKGSDKQVSWANQVRLDLFEEIIQYIDKYLKKVEQANQPEEAKEKVRKGVGDSLDWLKSQDNVGWWLDRRDKTVQELLKEAVAHVSRR